MNRMRAVLQGCSTIALMLANLTAPAIAAGESNVAQGRAVYETVRTQAFDPHAGSVPRCTTVMQGSWALASCRETQSPRGAANTRTTSTCKSQARQNEILCDISGWQPVPKTPVVFSVLKRVSYGWRILSTTAIDAMPECHLQYYPVPPTVKAQFTRRFGHGITALWRTNCAPTRVAVNAPLSLQYRGDAGPLAEIEAIRGGLIQAPHVSGVRVSGAFAIADGWYEDGRELRLFRKQHGAWHVLASLVGDDGFTPKPGVLTIRYLTKHYHMSAQTARALLPDTAR